MRRPWLTLAVVPCLLAADGSARAGETHEFWPELQFHYWFDDRRSRAIAMMSTSRDRDSSQSYQAESG